MKALVLSNTAGQGHRSTAGAISDMLESLGVTCRILDTFEYTDHLRYKIVDKGYLMVTKNIPKVFGAAYKSLEKAGVHDSMYNPINIDNSVLALKLKKYFDTTFYPDIVICTHVFSAQIMNVMKAKHWVTMPVIGVVTDYTLHPFWEDVQSIDYIVTASELLTYQTVKRGISKSKIKPFGIPINPKFCKHIDKTEARNMLGIDPDKRTILLMSGSMGYGNIAKELEKIDKLDYDFQILAVCGNNKQAKRKIDSIKTTKKVYAYGFVNNVDVMMDAADIIITKPGGLSSSEAFAKCLPMIMVNPIPGQEERNVEFMLNNGLAVYATKNFTVDDAINQFLMYPQKLENMKANIRLVSKPNATRDLCEFAISLIKNKENV